MDIQIKSKFQFSRKVLHLSGLLIPLIYFFDIFKYFSFSNNLTFEDVNRSLSFYILLILSLFILLIEISRFYIPIIQKIFLKYLGLFMKDDEKNRMSASFPFFFSHALLCILDNKAIATLGMLFLLIGDPVAAYFGSKYGKHRLTNGRSLEGTFCGILSCLILGMLFLLMLNLTNNLQYQLFLWDCCGFSWNSVLIIFWGAICAFIIELFSGHGMLDDNFLIPVGSSIVMILLFTFINHYSIVDIFYNIDKLLFIK